MAGRTLVSKFSPFVAAAARTPTLLRLRPLIAAGDGVLRRSPAASVSVGALRSYSSRPTTSSLNDPSPNWSNRPPKETILLDGCDFEHWLVVMEPPEPDVTRDDIIDSYIKTLSQVVGSEQEARMSIYSVSTKHYFAFGAKVSEELSYKIKALPKVRWVLPDSYLDVKNKDYGGEPFIDGQAVPYDPKYHEEWVRNNARANERSRRNDRPRNFDRSRNFERRRETMQNRDAPPMPNQGFQSGSTPPPPQNAAPRMPDQGFQSGPTPPPPQNAAPQPPPNAGYQQGPGYQGQGFQGQGYQQGPGYQGQGYQQGPGNPSYQQGPGNPGYQQGPGNPGYQQSPGNPGYQQSPGSPGYQQSPGNPGYQQSPGNPGYQQSGGPPPYQGNNSFQARNNSGYQGNPNNYQSGQNQGNPGNYQSGPYQGNTTSDQPGNGPTYPGRDVPGRD